MKILYFEGAGWDFYSEEQTAFSDVGNFRIRTAFKNLDGTKIYIELTNGARHDTTKEKPVVLTQFALYISHLSKIDGTDDENKRCIKHDWKAVRLLNYTKEDITRWINENLNCDFDTISVLDSFYGYHAHGDKHGTYNLMEDIDLNHARAVARKEAYNKIDEEYRTKLREKYSVTNLLEMDDASITIRCHASDQKLKELPRVQRVPVLY
ncbi:hypothetical protein [Terribacillus saccharophilus]|uniref:hypothetical protein n=1 Tax=Terribacillus saccharophilus TaxID=361277 RepID=UPI00298A06EC|nr:hypothetical protein [Terribacillus saccharophilus]MCM3227547.1 hypothetical protein [Terribacillus saccharophilus]